MKIIFGLLAMHHELIYTRKVEVPIHVTSEAIQHFSFAMKFSFHLCKKKKKNSESSVCWDGLITRLKLFLKY